jgi:hypothetical protein
VSRFFNAGNAVRLVVLLVVAGLALGVALVAQPRGTGSLPAADVEPGTMVRTLPRAPEQAQAAVPGATLVPAPAPRPQPRKARGARSQRHAATHGGYARRAHARRVHERRARARARALAHRNYWRHAGGRDISWPQCPERRGRRGLGQPMPDGGVGFVVVGLTAGRAFTANPCLERQIRWVRNHHVHASAYAFAAFPSRAQLRRHRHHGPYDGRRGVGALQNGGYAAARYNVRVMQQHGFTTPHVWLDVEPSSSHPWSHRRHLNRAVVRGWIRGYRSAGYTVGVYSTPLLWRHILGRFRPRLPEWRTAGPASARAALGRCSGESIQGGPAAIAQWWTAHRDFDRLCPGPDRATTLARYFHRW